ncbi:unnamed protein product, partial [Acanthoscelides obtectus]
KRQITNNELLDTLLRAIDTGGQKVESNLKQHIEDENSKLRLVIEGQNVKIKELEQKRKELESKYIHLERAVRRNNIVTFGLKVSMQEDNLLDKVCNELKEYLNVTVERPDIDNVFAIKTDKENVPVKIQFKSYLKKQEIFSNVHKLKGKSISIVNDMCYEDRKNFKVLLKHKKKANSKNIPVRIVGNSLEINGLRFTPDQLEVGIAVDDLATGQEAAEDGEVKQNQPDKRLLFPEQIQAEKKQKLDKGEKLQIRTR